MRIETSGDYAWRTNLDESCRTQVEHYLAITRYTMLTDDEGIDADDLRGQGDY